MFRLPPGQRFTPDMVSLPRCISFSWLQHQQTSKEGATKAHASLIRSQSIVSSKQIRDPDLFNPSSLFDLIRHRQEYEVSMPQGLLRDRFGNEVRRAGILQLLLVSILWIDL